MGSPEDPTTNSKPVTPASVVTNDTVIALVATVIIFSVIFSVQGMAEQVGKSIVGMLFISLPELFYSQVPFGSVLGPLFYVLIALAALTSTMSLLEVVTAYVIDERGVERRKATLVCGGVIFVFTILAAVSFGAVPAVTNLEIPRLVRRLLFGGKAGWFSMADHSSRIGCCPPEAWRSPWRWAGS